MVAPTIVGMTPNWVTSCNAYADVANLTSNTGLFSYPHTVTSTNTTQRKNEIKAAIDGGYTARNPTTVDWATVSDNYALGGGTSLLIPGIRDLTAGVVKAPCGGMGLSTSWCQPIIARNLTSLENSATRVVNRPTAWSMPGTDPDTLRTNKLYTLIGRHMSSTNADPSVFYWEDGDLPVNTAKLHECVVIPGRAGGSNQSLIRDYAMNTIDFYLPRTATGNGYLLVWTNENRYGMTEPYKIPVSVIGEEDPWRDTTSTRFEYLDVAPHTDISIDLTILLAQVAETATAAIPSVILLPPGTFYISHVIPIPEHVGIWGAGMHSTIIRPALDVHGVGNATGQFYYDLEVFSTDHDNCYSDIFNGSYGSLPGTPFEGDQFLTSSANTAMFRLHGHNIRIQDLTISSGTSVERRACSSLVNAGDGINDIQFARVRFENILVHSETLERQRTIDRQGRWRHWRFTDCIFNADEVFTAANTASQPFADVGAMDECMIEGCEFDSKHGATDWTSIGAVGRGCLVRDCRIRHFRKGFVSDDNGVYPQECVFFNNTFSEMVAQFGSAETVIMHLNKGILVTAASGGNTGGDGDDGYFVVNSTSTVRNRWVAHIVSGTGVGQYRTVLTSTSGGGNMTYVVEDPWDVAPASGSKIILMPGGADMAFIANNFIETSGGIMAWGNCLGFEFRWNTFRNSNEGLSITCQHYTAGTDIGASRWHSILDNTFINGGGIRLSGTRSSGDLASTWPMVSRVSGSRNRFYGDVVNQAFASLGTSITSGTTGDSALTTNPLVTFFSFTSERYLSGLGFYNHDPPSRAMIRRYPWATSTTGVANYTFETFYFEQGDGNNQGATTVNDLASIVQTSTAFNTSGQNSLSELIEEDIVGLADDITAIKDQTDQFTFTGDNVNAVVDLSSLTIENVDVVSVNGNTTAAENLAKAFDPAQGYDFAACGFPGLSSPPFNVTAGGATSVTCGGIAGWPDNNLFVGSKAILLKADGKILLARVTAFNGTTGQFTTYCYTGTAGAWNSNPQAGDQVVFAIDIPSLLTPATETDIDNIAGYTDSLEASMNAQGLVMAAVAGVANTINTNLGSSASVAGAANLWGKVKTVEGKVDIVDTNVDTTLTNLATIDGVVDGIASAVTVIDTNLDSTLANTGTIMAQTDQLPFVDGSVQAKLASDGLDDISDAPPNGLADTFREKLMQLYSRMLGASELDRLNQKIIVYRENGVTPAIEQSYVATATNEQIGAAESA